MRPPQLSRFSCQKSEASWRIEGSSQIGTELYIDTDSWIEAKSLIAAVLGLEVNLKFEAFTPLWYASQNYPWSCLMYWWCFEDLGKIMDLGCLTLYECNCLIDNFWRWKKIPLLIFKSKKLCMLVIYLELMRVTYSECVFNWFMTFIWWWNMDLSSNGGLG